MTVQQLIDKLQKIPDKNKEILVEDVYEGISNIADIEKQRGYLTDQELVSYYVINHD